MRLRIETLLPLLVLVMGCCPAHVCKRLCEGGAPSFSKDGRRMAFQRAVGDKMRVGVLDLKTGETVWPETAGNACHPFFASDGSLFYAYANITNTAYQRFILNGP